MTPLRLIRLRSQRHRRLAPVLEFDLGARVRRLLYVLLALSVAHTALMMILEGLGAVDALWLTLTTLTTVGYGDLSAATPAGRLATVLLLYLVGITVLAQLASDYIDYRIERRRRMLEGKWSWDMRDHLLIVNTPGGNAEQYCELLIRQIRDTPAFAELPVQFLTTGFPDGLPQRLREQGALHHHGEPDDEAALAAATPEHARYIVVLVHDRYDRRSDSLTFDTVHRIMTRVDPAHTHVVAECVSDANRERLRGLGTHSVIRPIRAYPELLIRSIVAPGVETMMENLFTHHGDHSQRYPVAVHDQRWADVVATLIQADLGTAMAYVDDSGEVICNPAADMRVHARALIVMVRSGQVPTTERVEACIGQLTAA